MTEQLESRGKDARNGVDGLTCEERLKSQKTANDPSSTLDSQSSKQSLRQLTNPCGDEIGTPIESKKDARRFPFLVNKITGVLVATIFVALLAVILNVSLRTTSLVDEADVQQSPAISQDKEEKIIKPVQSSLQQPAETELSAKQSTEPIKQEHQPISHVPDFLSAIKGEIVDDHAKKHTTIAQIDEFNNIRLLPRLKSIVGQDYFRYVKLNLNRQCRLWTDDHKCALRDCSVKICDESSIPAALIDDDSHYQRQATDEDRTANHGGDEGRSSEKAKEMVDQECVDPAENEAAESRVKDLSSINKTVASEQIDAMNALFECLEHEHDDGQYIDLLLNPERYTGYSGESAHRIWRAIYEENCFLRPQTRRTQQKNPFALDDMCYEERVFYRAISGLHASINIHLCANYPLVDGSFSYNLEEFIKRFKGKEAYIKNLYFLYLFELKALAKAEPYLLSKVNWMPNSGDLTETRDAIKDLLKTVRRFAFGFDETTLFKDKAGEKLAQEFSMHFHNITTNIMDCVACSKCRLWGKVQIRGLGTAFKILLTDIDRLNVNRHEINSLINALTRLSSSIENLEKFQQLIAGELKIKSQPVKPPATAKGKKLRRAVQPEPGFWNNM